LNLAHSILSRSIEFGGLNAPWFSWVVSAGVLIYCIYILANERRQWKRKAQSFGEGKRKIDQLSAENPTRPGQGLSLRVYDALSNIVTQALQLHDIWSRINSHIIKRTDGDGEERFWVIEPVTDLVRHEDVMDYRVYRQSSAIITGIGLFATFLAILVALLEVRVMDQKVEGLPLLIQGLSGKFMSSVAALFAAIVLLAAERRTFHLFHDRISRFTRSIDSVIPRITDAQILSDLHKDTREQSNLFKHFNTDLSFKLKESFGESVGPTLERMVTAIDDLNRHLREAEADKTKTMTGQLSDLLGGFERSILVSLERMGDQFSTSLTGNTQGQFDRLVESLTNSTAGLQEMNRLFATNRDTMSNLIDLAKTSTADQIQQGQIQVQDLTKVLKELMVQLQEKTGESLGAIEKTLTTVTLDMSQKVTDLSLQMASVIEETSGRSTHAAKQVLEQAGTVSARSAEQLEKLLERHTAETTRVEDLTLLLDGTLKGFVESIRHYGYVTESLRSLAAEANVTVTSITHVSSDVRQMQGDMAKTSSLVTEQIDSLKVMNQGQKETWGSIRDSMAQYESTFYRVEKQAKELLAQIGGFLGNYSSTTEEHFNKLGTMASNHISDATSRIAGSIDELREYLDDLQGILADFLTKVKR
jgi:hypothetical protein